MTDHLTLCSEARIRELLDIEQEATQLRAKLAQAEKSAKEWERLAVKFTKDEIMPHPDLLEGKTASDLEFGGPNWAYRLAQKWFIKVTGTGPVLTQAEHAEVAPMAQALREAEARGMERAAKIAEQPYGDAVDCHAGNEPSEVGSKIAVAIRASSAKEPTR